jgi:hypothetical protein
MKKIKKNKRRASIKVKKERKNMLNHLFLHNHNHNHSYLVVIVLNLTVKAPAKVLNQKAANLEIKNLVKDT